MVKCRALFGVYRNSVMAQVGQDAATKLFQAAVEPVLKDESFSIPSRPAIRARELARAQIEWSSRPESKPDCESFSAELVGSLKECCAPYHYVMLQRDGCGRVTSEN